MVFELAVVPPFPVRGPQEQFVGSHGGLGEVCSGCSLVWGG